MYRVLLIDDDKSILEGLKKIISWEQIGCEIVGAYQNPLDVIAACKSEAPDIIISDIRMPEISGVDLAKILVSRYPDLIFIMLTAYDDFSYAQQAVNSGVFRYLLKPINEKQLTDTLAEAIANINTRNSSIREMSELLQFKHHHESLEDLYTLLSGAGEIIPTENNSVLFADGKGAPYCMAVACIFTSEPNPVLLEDPDCFHLHTRLYDCYILPGAPSKTAPLLEQLAAQARFNHVNCALYDNLPSLSTLYTDFVVLTGYFEAVSFVKGDSVHVLHAPITNLIDAHSGDLDLFNRYIDELYVDYLHYDLAGLSTTLGQIDRFLSRQIFPVSHETVKTSFMQMLERLLGYYRQYYPTRTECIESIRNTADKIPALRHYKDLSQLCLTLFKNSFAQVERNNSSSPGQVVNVVKSYITLNLDKEIDLNQIAGAVHMSPNYLSSLFKKSTGEKLWSYVNRIRLERAYDYLTNTEMPIAQISSLCGFQNINTFYFAFKKQYGYAPGRLRSQNGSDS